MSIILLLYGIETPDADQPAPPPPAPTVASITGIGGAGPFVRRRYPDIVFNDAIERDDEELLILSD